MTKMKMPLRCGNTDRGQGKTHYEYYTPEFDERQAELIWKHDMRWIIGAAIVIVLLAVLGVI